MKPEIIESKYWKHNSGRTASLYGAVPWSSAWDKDNWTLETNGWTIKWTDGTIGTGRPAFKTHEEAVAYLEKMESLGLKGGWAAMTY